jgi:hypothetical protein
MQYMLSMPQSQFEKINLYFAEPTHGRKAAFFLTNINQDNKQCQIDITDFIAAEEWGSGAQVSGFGIQSPSLMDAIDKAMETSKSFLFLYSDNDLDDGGFNPTKKTTNQIVFRIAYHYLPFGLHACLAYSNSGLHGSAWLKDSTLRPMEIKILPS